MLAKLLKNREMFPENVINDLSDDKLRTKFQTLSDHF